MKDLSEKWKPNTRNRVDIGISKKNGTNEAKIKPYGPEVIEALGSVSTTQINHH